MAKQAGLPESGRPACQMEYIILLMPVHDLLNQTNHKGLSIHAIRLRNRRDQMPV